MKACAHSSINAQRGVMLLEVLIAVLLFSIGIMALIGLQAAAVKTTSESQYRATAALLANQIIAQMWADAPANLANYAHRTGGTNCNFTGSAATNTNISPWIGSTTSAGTIRALLPGATDDAYQQITVDTTTNRVEVRLCWKGPQETVPHEYVVVAQINS